MYAFMYAAVLPLENNPVVDDHRLHGAHQVAGTLGAGMITDRIPHRAAGADEWPPGVALRRERLSAGLPRASPLAGTAPGRCRCI